MTSARRKAIPDRVKLKAALARFGLRVEEVQFDHFPALGLREWDPVAKDTIPPANDPEFIQMLFLDEHRAKTSGRRGEKRSTSAGSDQNRIAKVKRNAEKNAEFYSRMADRGAAITDRAERETADRERFKRRIPSRPMNRRKAR